MKKKRWVALIVGTVAIVVLSLLALAFVTNDQDLDGITDDKDNCPNSNPQYGLVDQFGCDCPQKVDPACDTTYVDPVTGEPRACCSLTPLLPGQESGCEVRTTGPFRSVCCTITRDADGNIDYTKSTCTDGSEGYYPAASTGTATTPSSTTCSDPFNVDPNPAEILDDVVMSECCKQRITIGPTPIFSGDRARFFMGCTLMEKTNDQLYTIPTQSTPLKQTYNLGDPSNPFANSGTTAPTAPSSSSTPCADTTSIECSFYCSTVPSDPICTSVTQTPCEIDPSSTYCADFCVANPADPSCVNPCTVDPNSAACGQACWKANDPALCFCDIEGQTGQAAIDNCEVNPIGSCSPQYCSAIPQ